MLSHKEMYFSLLKMFPDVHIVSEEKSADLPSTIIPIELVNESITDKLGTVYIYGIY